MVFHKINVALIIIGIVGFILSSFYLLYSSLSAGFFLSLFFMILFIEAFILRVQHNHIRNERKKNLHHVEYFPLSSNFMLTSIIGFLGSLFVVLPLSLSWGVTFALVFFLMFISSMISMTKGPLCKNQEIFMAELAIHDKKRKVKVHK